MLEIQLDSLDEYERIKPHVYDVFRGIGEFDIVLIDDLQNDFYDIHEHYYIEGAIVTLVYFAKFFC